MIRRVNRRCVLVACASLAVFAFALPVRAADDDAKGGWLGVQISDLEDDAREENKVAADTGVLVDEVVEGGAAEMAGVKAGDIVTAVDGKPAPMVEGFVELITVTHKAGDKVELTVLREKKEMKIKVTLGTRPE